MRKWWARLHLGRAGKSQSVGLQWVSEGSIVAVGLLIKLDSSVPRTSSTLREKTTASGVLRVKQGHGIGSFDPQP